MLSRRRGWIACSKQSTRPMSPSPEMGLWISDSRISSSTDLSPWRKGASFLLPVASRFGAANSTLGLEGHDLGRQLGDVLFGGHSKVLLLLMLRVSRLKLSSAVRARLRVGMYHVLVLTELQWICGMGTQGDGSLLNALSRKCYMHMLQYVHRGTLP